MKKIFLLNLFFCFCLFAQGQDNFLNVQDYVILTTGNYVCGEFADNDLLYVIRNDTLFTLDIISMNETFIGQITGINSGQFISAIGYSFNSEIMYLGTTSLSTSELYSLDLSTATTSFIGIVGEQGLKTFDVGCSGDIYSIDIIDDMLWKINPISGVGTLIGTLGFDANYTAHSDFDLQLSTLYLVAFNNSTFTTQFRSVDLATGNTTLIYDMGSVQVTVFAIEGECGPGRAINPQPPDSSINISVTLNETAWENPADANGNEIWWGTDPENLVLVLSGGLFTNYSVPETLQYEQTYYWKVDETGPNGSSSGNIWSFTTEDNPSIVYGNESGLLKFSLEQNYPNPFNPGTKIRFVIPNGVRNPKDFSSQNPGNDNVNVTLKVFDVLGREVEALVNDEQSPGEYEVEFNGANLTSGIYFYQLKTG